MQVKKKRMIDNVYNGSIMLMLKSSRGLKINYGVPKDKIKDKFTREEER